MVDRNEPKKTKVVHNNGFNPEWKEKFEFKVHLPDLALLEIQGWFSLQKIIFTQNITVMSIK